MWTETECLKWALPNEVAWKLPLNYMAVQSFPPISAGKDTGFNA